MTVKEFFRFTKKKALISLLLFIVFEIIVYFYETYNLKYKLYVCNPGNYLCGTPLYFAIIFAIPGLIASYILACFLIFYYKKYFK